MERDDRNRLAGWLAAFPPCSTLPGIRVPRHDRALKGKGRCGEFGS